MLRRPGARVHGGPTGERGRDRRGEDEHTPLHEDLHRGKRAGAWWGADPIPARTGGGRTVSVATVTVTDLAQVPRLRRRVAAVDRGLRGRRRGPRGTARLGARVAAPSGGGRAAAARCGLPGARDRRRAAARRGRGRPHRRAAPGGSLRPAHHPARRAAHGGRSRSRPSRGERRRCGSVRWGAAPRPRRSSRPTSSTVRSQLERGAVPSTEKLEHYSRSLGICRNGDRTCRSWRSSPPICASSAPAPVADARAAPALTDRARAPRALPDSPPGCAPATPPACTTADLLRDRARVGPADRRPARASGLRRPTTSPTWPRRARLPAGLPRWRCRATGRRRAPRPRPRRATPTPGARPRGARAPALPLGRRRRDCPSARIARRCCCARPGSAGGRFPYELYVAAAACGLADGVHWYDPVGHALCRSARRRDGGATDADPHRRPWRTGWRYAERGFRHIYWDAGTVLAQTLGLADSAGSRRACTRASPTRR